MSSTDACLICLEPLGEVEDYTDSSHIDLACGKHQVPPNGVFHSFHRSCMVGWREHAEDEETCPTCRRPLCDWEFLTLKQAITNHMWDKMQRDSVRFQPIDAHVLNGLDAIMTQIAKVLNTDDNCSSALSTYGAIALKIMLESGPPDATFMHSVESSFRRLFDPDHAYDLAFELMRSDLIERMLVTARIEIASFLATPPAFQVASV